MKTLLLVFSGTGNTLHVANELRKNITQTDIVLIKKEDLTIDLSVYERIGILTPLYYYRIPKIIRNKILKTQFPKDKYIFAIITRGVYPEGGAIHQLQTLLREIDASLSYARYITMPINDITIYKPNPKKVDRILADMVVKVKKISREIIVQESKYDNEPLSFLASIVNNIFFNDSSSMDKYFSVKENECTKCGICMKICPVNNIALSPIPHWMGTCEVCLRCYSYCPKNAIKYKNTDSIKYSYTNPIIEISEYLK